MANPLRTLLFSLVLISLAASTYAQNCSGHQFENRIFATCINLPVLNSFLHWNYHQVNHTVDIAYRHTGVNASSWVAWALNVNGSGMIGAQALVAFRSSGSNIRAYTSPVSNYSTQLQEGPLSFRVPTISAEFADNGMTIFATLQLPAGSTRFNQVWQEGQVSGNVPQRHDFASANLRSTGTVDFQTGQDSGGGGATPPTQPRSNDCSGHRFANRVFATCNNLPVLNSFLHWNYHQANHTVDIAYRHTGVTASRWVAWALNVGGSGMIGAQSLVAFQRSGGNTRAYTSPVSAYRTQLQEGQLSFDVPTISAEFANNEMTIFATLRLPAGRTSFNQVWQEGPVSGDVPQQHALAADNRGSTGTVDFLTGQISGGGGGTTSTQRRRNVHGVLNVVSWGILMPLGAIIARYLRVFKSADPAWFYLHAACQTSAYAVGVAGWGTGLRLGSDSVGIRQNPHRNIGIALFCLGTLQVFALLLRPKKDHKFRFYWNIYHHLVGYTTIVLSIVNIFEGFDILDPEKRWKRAYIGVLIALGAIAALLEAFTWFVVLNRKSKANSNKTTHVSNGENGANGSGYRSSQP